MIDESLRNLAAMVDKDEKVLWFSKPNKTCFILECIFNPFLPFALLWFILDFTILISAATADNASETFPSILIFMLFHFTPVWIYLGGIFTCTIKYKNTAYMITTKGVYISSGLFTKNREMKPFTDLSHINIHRGIIDQFIGVGDVVLTCSHNSHSPSHKSGLNGFAICDIADYERVYKMISELQTDIYSDTMFPNALRPENNPGYNTQYNKYPEKNFEN